MKRVLTSAVAVTSTAQSRSICSTRVAHQVQRPDLLFETNGAAFADLSSPATSFGNSMYSKYRPSAPPADLAHTDVDTGLGTSARDPYTVTINNIPTTAPPMNAGNAVSYDQTGPVSMVMSPNTLSVGGSNSLQASAVANSKRQLTQDEIEALGKGAHTLSEWIGVRPQLSTVDVSAAGNPAATANNGLLRVYIENFLKIEAPVPVSSLTFSFISGFETAGIENMCLSAGRADTAVVAETWKSITKKFPNSTTSSEADLLFFDPEGFLSQVESLQREALFFLANLSPSSFSSNVSKDTPTDELLASAPEDAVRAIKGLVSIAIEARNEAIDTNIVSVVTNAQFFDEGNAVWRVLLNTFDGDKRQIFINASSGDASKEAVDPLADSPQLAEFDWVMSHDRPLPRVTAPVCLLFLLAALRAVQGSTATSASAALSSTQQATPLLDASLRQNVPKMSTLSRLSLVDDNIRAQIVAQALDKMFGNNAISSLGVDAATAKKQQSRSRQNAAEGVAAADPKKFVDHLRAAGFDVSVLQQVELMAVQSQQQRDAEASRSKTVAGTSDVGAPVTATSGDASKGKEGSKGKQQSSSSSEQEASSTNSTVVLNTNISKAMKAQITPLISLFVNGKGVSAAFQELYRVLSGGAGGTPVLGGLSNTELLHHISGVLGFGPKAENIASVFNQNSPKFASFWAANYKVYAEAILSDVRLLGALTATIGRMLQGNANLSEGIVSKESRRALDLHLKAVGRDGAEEAERATLVREVLLAPHNVSRVVDALAKAGADVSSLFNLNNERALIHRRGASDELSLVDALLSGGDRSAVHQVGNMVIARHPYWASAGVIPPKGEYFTADNIVAIAAHVFVRLSYVPHTALALMKRNYRGRIGDIFLPDTTATSENGTPVAQPRHHNLPIELGKVEHYDTHLYKRNDPQGWYQRMRDIHNRNVSVKIAMADLRTVSDDFTRPQATFGESASSSSSSSSSPASSSEYNTNSESGKQVYFGTQHERRLRVLAGERVGMNIIKLDSDRYEDADDNEKYGLAKLQQLLSESKKVELGKAYWPSVEVKVRYPSGQSRSMQSLIDYARNEAQSKELYEQYREIKKTALFVSPMDLYLKDRSEAAAISNSSARTSVTSEGYVVGVE